ncbi:MAG: tetratricopeptide repeat protein, partial [Candidatus Sericytochromatia bacterium]|nr:tetratricopeptide repeat protein [Candidatus Tanganyikabacteria bacterium]
MALFGEDLVTRTKFVAPRLRGAHVPRERLARLLAGALDVPLTVVLGGAGYGKSTALAGFLEATGTPGLWYELGDRDADPQVLALHLAHLCERAYPGAGQKALGVLARPGGASVHWAGAAEALCDGLLDRLATDTLLVLDDFEVLERANDALLLLNHLVGHLPPRLHVAIATRTRPALPHLARWRLDGDVLTIDQEALAFDAEEATALFGRLGADLPDAPRLVRDTAGWPMAVQLLARRAGAGNTAALLADPENRRDLFEYLAREVLDVLPAAERDFLLATAPLGRLDAAVCEALTGRHDAGAILQRLADRGILLVAPPDDALRPHHLFRDFLVARLADAGRLEAGHRAAAAALDRAGRLREAVDHLIAAGDEGAAAARILSLGPDLVRQGLFETVAAWLRRLSDAVLDGTPDLAKLQGDACRLAARFDAALAWYDRAIAAQDADPEGRSRALAAKAQVFLDTVRPAMATALLEEAARLARDPRERADLQVLLAENALNLGDPAKAAARLEQAGEAAPDAAEIRGRLLLRTGHLKEARDWLRALLDREGSQAVKAHREAALVLSLVEAFLGDAAAARDHAERGLARARQQGAAWGEAVGLIRAGHASLVAGAEREAGALYRKALDIADSVGVDRLTSEPLVGLTVLAGRRGDLAEAERHAQRALEAARKHGDAWMAALAQLGLGTALVEGGDPRGREQCERAGAAFAAVSDVHGELRANLLASSAATLPSDTRGAAGRLGALAAGIRDAGLGALLAGPSLLGFAGSEQ